MSPEEVLELSARAKAAGCAEALLTLGERPEVHAQGREKLHEFGFRSTVDYLEHLCKQILGVGLLPHTNAGLLSPQELARLRRYNASMGLMLETLAELPAHTQSPGKKPEHRLSTIEAAGKLRIPFTTGLLVGIGESQQDRARSLLAILKLHERYGHIQEVIIQPFVPKPRTPMAEVPSPSFEEVMNTLKLARSLMPRMNLQVPPNLLGISCGSRDFNERVSAALRAGANDFGGVSTITPDFINPQNPWPTVGELRRAILRAGFRPRERLPIYPEYVKRKFMSPEVELVVCELADEAGYRAN
jgi:FO synthase subunit 1